MSDHRERACWRCGSLLHHEDDGRCEARHYIAEVERVTADRDRLAAEVDSLKLQLHFIESPPFTRRRLAAENDRLAADLARVTEELRERDAEVERVTGGGKTLSQIMGVVSGVMRFYSLPDNGVRACMIGMLKDRESDLARERERVTALETALRDAIGQLQSIDNRHLARVSLVHLLAALSPPPGDAMPPRPPPTTIPSNGVPRQDRARGKENG